MSESRIDLETHQGSDLLGKVPLSVLLGCVIPKRTPQALAYPKGTPMLTNTHAHAHTRTHAHVHLRETSGLQAETGLRLRLHSGSALQPPEHGSSRGR